MDFNNLKVTLQKGGVLLILFLWGLTGFCNRDRSRAEYLIQMLSEAYESGNYQQGLKRCKDLEATVAEQKGSESLQMAQIIAYKGLLHGCLSRFDLLESEMDSSEKLIRLHPANADVYSQVVLTHVRSQVYLNNYQKAMQWLDLITPMVTDSSLLYYEVRYERQKCLKELGYLKDADAELTKLRREVELLPDTTLACKKLRTRVFFLHFDLLFEQGQDARCAGLLNAEKLWIQSTFGYKYGVQAEFFFRRARLFARKRDFKEANFYFKKAHNYGMRFYALHAPFFVDLQHQRIENLLAHGKLPEANYWMNDLDVRVLSYYGRKSSAFLEHKMQKLERACVSEDWNSALDQMVRLQPYVKFLPDGKEGLLRFYQLAFQIQQEKGELTKADSILREILFMSEAIYGKSSPRYHVEKLRSLRFKYVYTNDFDGVSEQMEKSLEEVLDKHYAPDHEEYFKGVFWLAQLYVLEEKYDAASEKINALIDQMNASKRISFSRALIESCWIKTHKGDYEKALDHIKKALWKLKDEKYYEGRVYHAKALRAYGFLLKQIGDFRESERVYAQSDRLFGDELFNTNKTPIQESGWLMINQGKFRRCARLIEEEQIRLNQTRGTDHYSQIDLLLLLAQIHIETGEYFLVEENLKSAEKIAREVFGDRSEVYSRVLALYREYYVEIGSFKKAVEKARQSVSILKGIHGEGHVKTAVPLSELGLSQMLYNGSSNGPEDSESSVAFIGEAIAILKAKFTQENALLAEVLENSGKVYLLSGELPQAFEDISRSRDLWKNTLGEPNSHVSQLDYMLGEVAFLDSAYADALLQFDNSAKGYKSLFGSAHPDYIESLGMSGRMHFILGDIDKSTEIAQEVVDKSLFYIQTIFPSLSEKGKSRYWNKVKEHFEFFYHIAFTQTESRPELVGKVFDISLQTKAILLNSSVKTKNFILQSGDSNLIKMFDTWLDTKEKLVSAVSMSHNERRREGLEIKDLEEEIEEIERFLSKRALGFQSNGKKQSAWSWTDLVGVLDPQDHVIEIVGFRVFDKGFQEEVWYGAMGLNAGSRSVPEFAILKNGDFLHGKGLKFYRNAIKYDIEDKLSYGAYWEPIQPLASKTGKTFISFDGVFNKINLETILLPSGEHVIDAFQLQPIGTSRDLLEGRKVAESTSRTSPEAAFFGNPQFYSEKFEGPKSWRQLSGTQKEVVELSAALKAEQWETSVHQLGYATEERVKAVRSPEVFHIATHGFFVKKKAQLESRKVIGEFSENPLLRSGVLLTHGGDLFEGAHAHEFNRADGILTAYEAMNLDLEQTKLVVLSACETGLGDVELGEGVFGLQRSFVVAGADNVIITLFKVSDEVTTELMTSFYHHWNQGLTLHEAFIEAKKEIRDKHDKSIYWGAFVLLGTGA